MDRIIHRTLNRDQKNHLRKEKMVGYSLLYLFIALTSVPFFIGDEYLIFNTVLSLAVFLYRKKKFDKFIFQYSIIFLLIFSLQSFFFSALEMNVIIAYFTRIFYAYFTIKILGKNIVKYYVNIIYFFSIISFVFYIPTLIFGEIVVSFMESISNLIEPFQLHEPGRSHILIYTFGEQYTEIESFASATLERNSGPFWEPGGFGAFLVIAIIFEIISQKKLLTKKNSIFILAALTTLSTGTFVVLFVLIVLYLIIYHDFKKIVFLICFLGAAIFIYTNTFFLSEKVGNQAAGNQIVSLKYTPRTRFVSAQLDMIDFMNYPILGRGRYSTTRFDDAEDVNEPVLNHRNNGTTNLLVEFGSIGFITFFFFMYKSFRVYCIANNFKKKFAVVCVIVIMLLGFSQMLFIKPFFIGLSFFFLAANFKNNSTSATDTNRKISVAI